MKFLKFVLSPIFYILGLIFFLYGMNRLAFSLWWNRLTLRASSALPVMIVHFDHQRTNPSDIAPMIEKHVSDPYKQIHGYPPVVLMMPLGMTFSSLNWSDFTELLTTDQRSELQNALYRKRSNIVLVK